jgi:hypothetical protein
MMARTKTVLERIQQQRRIDAQRARLAAEREAANADQIALAIDKAQDDRLAAELGPIFRAHGHGLVAESPAARADRTRVEALIKRDQIDRSKERDRRLAEMEVAKGVFVNLTDTVLEPTPEWLAKGEVGTFTPKQPDDTVRVIKTVRRVSNPVVARMHAAGRLSDAQYAACRWYRARHEAAGLEGRYKSSNLSLAGNVGGGTGGGGQAPMALHEFEAEARIQFRAARAKLTAFTLRFFEAVVLGDVPVSRSWRMSRAPKHKAETRFRDEAQRLANFCDENGIETGIRDDD